MTTNQWKIRLQSNNFDNTTYVARVQSASGALGPADIAKRISQSGSDIKYNTIMWVIRQTEEEIMRALTEGRSVRLGIGTLCPSVRGVFDNPNTTPTQARSRLGISFRPSEQMRTALLDTSVQVTGVQQARAYIAAVVDDYTGRTDGTLTSGHSATVHGRCVKVSGTHPDVGISLTDEQGRTLAMGVPTTSNSGSEVRFGLPPDTPAGRYRLRIATQYAGCGRPLKTPRIIETDITVA